MPKRGRPVGSTSVPAGRDAKVVMWVARCVYQLIWKDKDVTLRDRMDVGGRLLKAPPESAYKHAKENLAKHENIHIGIESIAKIYKRRRADFLGERDIIASARSTSRMLRRMQGLPVPVDEPMLPQDDSVPKGWRPGVRVVLRIPEN